MQIIVNVSLGYRIVLFTCDTCGWLLHVSSLPALFLSGLPPPPTCVAAAHLGAVSTQGGGGECLGGRGEEQARAEG